MLAAVAAAVAAQLAAAAVAAGAARAAVSGATVLELCGHADDFVCDDGGGMSEFDLCELGTDCNDCGPRDEDGMPVGDFEGKGEGSDGANSCQHATTACATRWATRTPSRRRARRAPTPSTARLLDGSGHQDCAPGARPAGPATGLRHHVQQRGAAGQWRLRPRRRPGGRRRAPTTPTATPNTSPAPTSARPAGWRLAGDGSGRHVQQRDVNSTMATARHRPGGPRQRPRPAALQAGR